MGDFVTRPVRRALTVGERLRRARRTRHLTLEQVETDTLIRKQYLELFEKDDFDRLPADVYAVGFLERYAAYLKLKTGALIEQFRSERGLVPAREPQNTLQPIRQVKDIRILITPKLFIASSVSLFVVGIFVYIGFAVRNFTAHPALQLKTPSELITAQKAIAVEGSADQASTVTINHEPVAVQNDGSFKETVALHQGVNIVEVVATNRTQRETRKTLTIYAPEESQ